MKGNPDSELNVMGTSGWLKSVMIGGRSAELHPDSLI
jgi:hypothetical protein